MTGRIPTRTSSPQASRSRPAAANRGSVMLYILLVMGLVTVVTIGVMRFIAADLSAGIRQLQAVRVFNIAEAGVHYALARLQQVGADAYAGETVAIDDGGTVLGTAAGTVSCLDGQRLPCGGTNAAHRGITVYGDLAANGTISLLGPASSPARVRADPPPPYPNSGYYTGGARAS